MPCRWTGPRGTSLLVGGWSPGGVAVLHAPHYLGVLLFLEQQQAWRFSTGNTLTQGRVAAVRVAGKRGAGADQGSDVLHTGVVEAEPASMVVPCGQVAHQALKGLLGNGERHVGAKANQGPHGPDQTGYESGQRAKDKGPRTRDKRSEAGGEDKRQHNKWTVATLSSNYWESGHVQANHTVKYVAHIDDVTWGKGRQPG